MKQYIELNFIATKKSDKYLQLDKLNKSKSKSKSKKKESKRKHKKHRHKNSGDGGELMKSTLSSSDENDDENNSDDNDNYANSNSINPHLVNTTIEMPEGATLSDTDDIQDVDVNDPHRALDIDLDM